MKKLVIGILAHVDAGKTTLSEAMLYQCGVIRTLGRVDNKDAFLDTHALERNRGITIFSKQAQLQYKELSITLLDTPGHVDFSAEMERTLQVLDYAVLMINGMDGVQGHTLTVWQLLKKYKVPVFLFINKMDSTHKGKELLLENIKKRLDDGCIDFSEEDTLFLEDVATTDEEAMEYYLEHGTVAEDKIRTLILQRKVFPCFFGSALKVEGVDALMEALLCFCEEPVRQEQFGARIYKISRDGQGNRLTFMKITGGRLKVKELLDGEQKVNQIRIYSGEKYEVVAEAEAGSVCAVTGPVDTFPGQGIGIESEKKIPVLEPVLCCTVLLPDEVDAAVMLPKIRQLEEEDPLLHVVWKEDLQEIQVQVMGEIQMEILKQLIAERFGVAVSFGAGNIVYKETIKNTVEGVGHYEPLKHYAEVHLKLEPGEPGSGLCFAADCSEDLLARNWQRLILTHLEEKEHIGVLTGSAITDMKITLVAGKAHLKHTEGGDFRQATYRAVRQGLQEAESVLLEPFYEFRMEVPETAVGRAMTDLEKMHGNFELAGNVDGIAVLNGMVPAATIQDYQTQLHAYTKGMGKLSLSLKGYYPCHNAEEVIGTMGYDAEADTENPTGSVFCAHGAGFVVPWDEVKEHMHLECACKATEQSDEFALEHRQTHKQKESVELFLAAEEIDAILDRTYHANDKSKASGKGKMPWKKKNVASAPVRTAEWTYEPVKKQEEYMLVDGYNIIFAWEDLQALAAVNMDSARDKLLDVLCDYQGMRGCKLIVVFDAYRVKGHDTEVFSYHNIQVVYTKEAQTADSFIEQFAHENSKKYRITVATSDGMEQIIIRGQGCALLSARELQEEVEHMRKHVREEYLDNQPREKNRPLEQLLKDIKGE